MITIGAGGLLTMAGPGFLDSLTAIAVAAGAVIALSTLLLNRGTKRVEILADLHHRPVSAHAAFPPLVEGLFVQAFRQAFFPESSLVGLAIGLGITLSLSGAYLIAIGFMFLLGLAWTLAAFLLVLGVLYSAVGLWMLSRIKVRKKGQNDHIRDWLMQRETQLMKQHEATRESTPAPENAPGKAPEAPEMGTPSS